MSNWKILLLLLLTAIFPLLSTGASSVDADQITSTEEISAVEKPIPYAQFARNSEITDIISEELFQEPEKSVLISLADQTVYILENGEVVRECLTSTGVPGHRTPTGSYSVHNKSPNAYSNRYECYMPNWMAITPDGLYGMHALQGTSYLRHLGSVASHGCIRLSPEDAEWLYGWTEIGTPVEIVDDWDPPEAKSISFRVSKLYCE